MQRSMPVTSTPKGRGLDSQNNQQPVAAIASSGSGHDSDEDEPLELVEPTPLPCKLQDGFRSEDVSESAGSMTEEECPYCGKGPDEGSGCCWHPSNAAVGEEFAKHRQLCSLVSGRERTMCKPIAWVCSDASRALRHDEDFQRYLNAGVVVVKFFSCSAPPS